MNEINDPFATSFIESEISHIEHGIILLTPSWFDIVGFIALALGFGYFCYKLGAIAEIEKTALVLDQVAEKETSDREKKLKRIEERYKEGRPKQPKLL